MELSTAYKKVILVLFVIVVLTAYGRAEDVTEVTNNICPVLTDEKVDSTIFTIYEGKRVYFCCNKCRRQFLAEPEKFVANLPQFASATAAGSEHDHQRDHGNGEHEFNLVVYLGKFHPLATHFPIALIITAFIFSAGAALTKKETYDNLSIKLTYLSALSALVTLLLGLAAGSSASYPSELKQYFEWHRLMGIGTTLAILFTASFARLCESRRTKVRILVFRGMLLVSAVAVGIAGHLGASLVFGPEHFAF